MSLNGRAKRVGRLEETIGGEHGGGCPECGGPPAPDAPYELLFDDDFEEMGEESPQEDVFCEECGALIVGVIGFEDDEDY